MLRRSYRPLRQISFVTDVEGDMAFFERYVAMSKVVQWEKRDDAEVNRRANKEQEKVGHGRIRARASSDKPEATREEKSHGCALHSTSQTPVLTVAELTRQYWLGFKDETAHFVYGGDVFDHGPDLSVAQALLDFKRRYPDRVHLILGNRDLNKMVMAPMAALSGAFTATEPPAPFAEAMTADDIGNCLFPARLHAARPGGVGFVSYGTFLGTASHYGVCGVSSTSGAPRETENGKAEEEETQAAHVITPTPVTMLKWALKYKLGSPNAFEHRRTELARLRAAGHDALVRDLVLSPRLKSPDALEGCGPAKGVRPLVTDGEVASSFFRAAEPGGVYHAYMQHGVLSKCLHGILFVHGGLTEHNLGITPSTSVDVPQTAWTRVGPLADAVHEASTPPRDPSEDDGDVHSWLRALEQFKQDCWEQWSTYWWDKSATVRTEDALRTCTGEPLRTYVYPREVVPYSVTVASPVHQDGPSYAALPVVFYLLSGGLHVVCTGHQPAGELPAIVRQPPADAFVTLTGDNSYCGNARASHLCRDGNQRGKAVAEIIFTVDDDAPAESPIGSVASIYLHGRDALGTPYGFDVKQDPFVGTGLPDHWWVRSCRPAKTEAATVPSESHSEVEYEVVRTKDGFRTVECRTVSAAALREECASMARQPSGGGVLKDRFTKAELADVPVHRLKTKVSPSTVR